MGTAYLEAAGNHQLQVAKLCCEGVRCRDSTTLPIDDDGEVEDADQDNILHEPKNTHIIVGAELDSVPEM